MRHLIVATVFATGVFAGTDARADGLTPTEKERLDRFETVVRPQTVDRGDRHYIGGLTYTVLDASPDEVAALLDDATALQKVLPRTKDAHYTGRIAGDRLLEVTQGNALVEATYTVRIKRDPAEARFWLEPSLPHGIDDAWGFFRWQSWGESQTLLTYGVLVDVGGIGVFEDRIRAALLSVPQHVRRQLAVQAETARGATAERASGFGAEPQRQARVRTASYTTPR